MKNQLQVIVNESGLEKSKGKYILEQFQNYFTLADEWREKAKTIKVTNASQETEMQMARAGRLFLQEKRVAVEKARVKLKEQSLRESQIIDSIAKILTNLIKPIEEYLEKQEHFVENKIAAEIEAKEIEAARIAKEKSDAKEKGKIFIENERLKREAEIKLDSLVVR